MFAPYIKRNCYSIVKTSPAQKAIQLLYMLSKTMRLRLSCEMKSKGQEMQKNEFGILFFG